MSARLLNMSLKTLEVNIDGEKKNVLEHFTLDFISGFQMTINNLSKK
jgi:hypothetical protein